jgi:hypothetical protein
MPVRNELAVTLTSNELLYRGLIEADFPSERRTTT